MEIIKLEKFKIYVAQKKPTVVQKVAIWLLNLNLEITNLLNQLEQGYVFKDNPKSFKDFKRSIQIHLYFYGLHNYLTCVLNDGDETQISSENSECEQLSCFMTTEQTLSFMCNQYTELKSILSSYHSSLDQWEEKEEDRLRREYELNRYIISQAIDQIYIASVDTAYSSLFQEHTKLIEDVTWIKKFFRN